MLSPKDSRLPRISFRHIAEYLLEVLSLERGMGYALRSWLLTPGRAAQEYLFEDRRRMMKPLPLLLLLATITTFLSFYFLDLETELSADSDLSGIPPALGENVRELLPLVRQYFHITLVSNLPLQALATFLIFRGEGLFYAEHLVINAYISCVQYLFILPVVPLVAQAPSWGAAIGLLPLAYLVYALVNVFSTGWWQGLLKAMGVFLLTQLLYSIALALLIMVLSFT